MATEVATLLFEADTRPLKSANQELNKTERAGVRAQDAARKMGTELKKAANDSVNPLQKVSRGVSALSIALTALASALVVRQFIAYTDQWTDLNSRLINATGSAQAADEALKAISRTAQTTYSSLQQTAEAFLLNSLALTELGFTTKQQVELADSMNNALVISGTKGQQAASVMNALSKAMALGRLSGENFNTVIQSGDRLLKALADGMGVTTNELRKLSTEGLITTEVMVEALSGQMITLRREAEAMPATIGDAMLQFSNFALEAVGRLDEAAGLSASIADMIVRSVAGFRAEYMPIEQEQINRLFEERLELTEKLEKRLMRPMAANRAKARIREIEEEMDALSSLNVQRQRDEIEAQQKGINLRQEQQAQREQDHAAELNRIETEKQARFQAAAEAQREARTNVEAQGIVEGLLSDEDAIKLSYERQRQTILDATQVTADKKLELLKTLTQREIEALDEIYNQNIENEQSAALERFEKIVAINQMEAAERNRANEERVQAEAQQTEQLMGFQNMLLQNKSESTQAAAQIGANLLSQEKRQNASKIVSDSYTAAMGAYKALAGIPFIGPALGAAAAATVLAAGVSYSAKSLSGRALGGQVRSGESYVVGERGPEILTMGATGNVIPNSNIRNQATGVVNKTANVSFNITANDASGFDTLLNASRGKIIDIVNTALNDGGREALL